MLGVIKSTCTVQSDSANSFVGLHVSTHSSTANLISSILLCLNLSLTQGCNGQSAWNCGMFWIV